MRRTMQFSRVLCGVTQSVLLLISLRCGAQYLGPTVQQMPPSGAVVTEADSRGIVSDRAIRAGDVISIYVFGMPELSVSTPVVTDATVGAPPQISGVRVSPNGTVVLPYLGEVTVASLTPEEAAERLRDMLKKEGLLVEPAVSVAIVDAPGRIVSVVGEVTRPSPVRAFEKIRLLDAISACGGFTAQASHILTIHRLGRDNPMVIDLGSDPTKAGEANLALQAGDTIVVPKQGGIYVVGEVKSAAMYMPPNNEPMTVMRAVTMAGGLKFSASLSRARIYRTTGDQKRVVIPFDLKKLMYGKRDDITLAANDVLFIPSNPWKATLAAGGVTAAESILYGATYAESTLK